MSPKPRRRRIGILIIIIAVLLQRVGRYSRWCSLLGVFGHEETVAAAAADTFITYGSRLAVEGEKKKETRKTHIIKRQSYVYRSGRCELFIHCSDNVSRNVLQVARDCVFRGVTLAL